MVAVGTGVVVGAVVGVGVLVEAGAVGAGVEVGLEAVGAGALVGAFVGVRRIGVMVGFLVGNISACVGSTVGEDACEGVGVGVACDPWPPNRPAMGVNQMGEVRGRRISKMTRIMPAFGGIPIFSNQRASLFIIS